MPRLTKYSDLLPHHRYQLEVILLFAIGIFLFIPYYLFMDEFNLNMDRWQWYFFVPWIVFYAIYSLNMRSQTKPEEAITPLKRPIVHWALLGILIIFFHLQTNGAVLLRSVDIMFAIATVFLADSYWDFKHTRLFRK